MIRKSGHLSLPDYDALVSGGAFDDSSNKVELIWGEIVEVNPAGPIHDDYVTYLTNWSAACCDRTMTLITSQTGLELPEVDSRPEPDVFRVRKARYRQRHPMATDIQLAMEVADSSLEKDLQVKGKIYAQVGILEYWIVDCQSNCVHVLRDPRGPEYLSHQVFYSSDVISPLVSPSAVLNLRDMFEGE